MNRYQVHSSERGSAMIPAVMFALVVMGYVVSIVASGLALQKQTRGHIAVQEAQQAAESGVHLLAAKLSGPDRVALLAAGGTEGVLRGTGDKALRYEARLRSGGDDLADNDLDGEIDEPDESEIFEVVSVGTADGVVRAVHVTLLARYRSPSVGSATYIADPYASLTLNGSAIVISGHDVDMSGAPTGEVVPGIGVNGDPSYVRSQIAGHEESSVIGLGADPSVHSVPVLDVQSLIEEGARSANVTLEGHGVHAPAEPGDWGTVSEPAVVYASDSIKISGGSEGAGVLLVNGDLEISGEFLWRGAVIVRGSVVFKGGGGGKRVIGALIVAESVTVPTETETTSEEVAISGTVDILFSRATVQQIGRVLSAYTILNWREGPTPAEEALP